jgi:hypothetical protein
MILALGAAAILLVNSSAYGQTPESVPASEAAALHGTAPASTARVAEYYGKLPLSFVPNQGQATNNVQFLSHGLACTLYLEGAEAVLELEKAEGGRLLRMKLVGANARAAVAGAEELSGKSNYFLGNDPSKWRTNVPNYAKVRYRDIYPGVDLVYYGTQGGQLEYDFVVAPGADPRAIGVSLQGAEEMRVDQATGDLVVTLGGSELRFLKPLIYQLIAQPDGRAIHTGVEGGFVFTGKNQVGFQVGAYDRTAPLIIDPVLSYSTFLGGSQFGLGTRVAVDSSGSAYVAGGTNSSDFTETTGLNLGTCSNEDGFFYHYPQNLPCPDAFVTKLNPAGTALVYSTYLGGTKADAATGISVDSSGNAYVTGLTGSANFPTTTGAYQTAASAHRSHAFATKLNPAGSVLYSTYLAGSLDDASTISTIDSSGNLCVAGNTNSPDFPTTAGAFQTALAGAVCKVLDPTLPPEPCPNGFIAKLSPDGSKLLYSTYLGGSKGDALMGLAVDAAGNMYVTGGTFSTDFPTANAGGLEPSFGTLTCGTIGSNPKTEPCFHAFVSELKYTGEQLVYSSFLGGNGYDAGLAIAVDSTGAAYVTGGTNSSQFPTTTGAAQTTFGGGTCGNAAYLVPCPDAFVVKVAPNGTAFAYSTYLGGNNYDFGTAIAVDSTGDAYVVGGTGSLNFPVDNSSAGFAGGSCKTSGTYSYPGFSFNCPNAFVTVINPTGSSLQFSTYLGGASGDIAFGVALDPSGNFYVAGSTLSATFPITPGAFQTSLTGYADAFITQYTAVGNTPEAQIVNLQDVVKGLITSGALSPALGQSLLVPLNNALSALGDLGPATAVSAASDSTPDSASATALGRKGARAAILDLEIFIDRVRILVIFGKLKSSEGRVLINAAESIIETLRG